MKISLNDTELKRISRYTFFGMIALALAYVFMGSIRWKEYVLYAFFVDYAVFLLSSAVLDRRKKKLRETNQSTSREIYSTISGAGLIIIGLLGLVIAGAMIFSWF